MLLNQIQLNPCKWSGIRTKILQFSCLDYVCQLWARLSNHSIASLEKVINCELGPAESQDLRKYQHLLLTICFLSPLATHSFKPFCKARSTLKILKVFPYILEASILQVFSWILSLDLYVIVLYHTHTRSVSLFTSVTQREDTRSADGFGEGGEFWYPGVFSSMQETIIISPVKTTLTIILCLLWLVHT